MDPQERPLLSTDDDAQRVHGAVAKPAAAGDVGGGAGSKDSAELRSLGGFRQHCIDGTLTELYAIEAPPHDASAASGAHRCAVVVFPGNPGTIGMYVHFLNHLFVAMQGRVSVFGASLAGHDCLPASKDDRRVYNLDAQVLHCRAVLRHLRDRHGVSRFVLVGHSIGAHLCVATMRGEPELHFERALLLFPFVRFDPSWQKTLLACTVFAFPWKYFLFALIWFVSRCLPRSWVRWLVQVVGGLNPASAQRFTSYVSLRLARNMQHLGKSEFAQLPRKASQDDKAVEHWRWMERHAARLVFHYGVNDHWGPLEQHHELRCRLAAARFVVDPHGSPHAFVVSDQHSELVARDCANYCRHLFESDV